jgi:pimeloyl-ACP methyl ester carboxylesterase
MPAPWVHTSDSRLNRSGWFSPAALAQPHGLAQQVRGWLHEAQLSGWADALDLIATFDVLREQPQVSVPVDVICAELDQVATPEHMTKICAALPLGPLGPA